MLARHHQHQFIAFYENNALKDDFCKEGRHKYTGTSLSFEEFCHFKYQDLPHLSHLTDLTMNGVQPTVVKEVTVCLMKTSL